MTTYISEYIDQLNFPTTNVTVLSPERTFWEKATLIHVECNRKNLKADPDRISRHWYDLVKMSESDMGKEAIRNTDLLRDVIKLKKIFFNSAYANYDDCTDNRFQLIPNDKLLSKLNGDFKKMIDAQMFYSETPSFEKIIKKISKLEQHINALNNRTM